MSPSRFPILVCWLILAILTGCGGSAEPVREDVPRLISLNPQITHTLGELGAIDRMVGRSDYCTHPPQVLALPTVGTALTPNLEKIAGLQPTAILVDAGVGNHTDDLRAVGPVQVLPWLTVDDAVASAVRLGELVGDPGGGRALSQRFATLEVPAPNEGPRVLFALGGGDLQDGRVWFIRPDSLHGAALHAAGFRNAVDASPGGAPELSLERLVQLDPDAIVVLTTTPVDDAVRDEVTETWSRMRTLTAVKRGRVGVVGGPMAMSTGPAVVDLVDALRAELNRIGVK